jgi:hypothetical protein
MLISLILCRTNEVVKFMRVKDKDGKTGRFISVKIRIEWWQVARHSTVYSTSWSRIRIAIADEAYSPTEVYLNLISYNYNIL